MKYCSNCRRVFDDQASYCPTCGTKLIEPERYDIFGEKIEEKKNIKDDIEEIRKEEVNINPKYYQRHAYEILSYISIASWLLPVVGLIIPIISFSLTIKSDKKRIGLLILSVISFILCIIYMYILYINGVFHRLFLK